MRASLPRHVDSYECLRSGLKIQRNVIKLKKHKPKLKSLIYLFVFSLSFTIQPHYKTTPLTLSSLTHKCLEKNSEKYYTIRTRPRLSELSCRQVDLTNGLSKLVHHLHLFLPSVRSTSIQPEEEALRSDRSRVKDTWWIGEGWWAKLGTYGGWLGG